jgi:hypothetical protein
MYAQLIPEPLTPERIEDRKRLVRDLLIHALEDEPGFAGALSLVNNESGEAITILLWENKEHANLPFSRRGTATQRAVAEISEPSTRAPLPSIWEVNAEV